MWLALAHSSFSKAFVQVLFVWLAFRTEFWEQSSAEGGWLIMWSGLSEHSGEAEDKPVWHVSCLEIILMHKGYCKWTKTMTSSVAAIFDCISRRLQLQSLSNELIYSSCETADCSFDKWEAQVHEGFEKWFIPPATFFFRFMSCSIGLCCNIWISLFFNICIGLCVNILISLCWNI